MLLSLWSLTGVFIHSYVVSDLSFTRRYLNMYLMSEGFIYILFSALLLIIAIRHLKNIRIFYILIPIAMIPTIQQATAAKSVTFIASIGISIIVWLLLNKRYLWSALSISIGLIFIKLNWHWIIFKFTCRPYVWKHLIVEIINHPFVGSGWNKLLQPPNNMVWIDGYGYLWKHNDYLSLGAYMGIFATIAIVWFLISSFRRIGKGVNLIPILSISIMSCFQMTIFQMDKASVYLVTGAICLAQSYKKGEL